MPKDKEAARAEGFKRGLAGKVGTSSLIEGWTDDRAAGEARTLGFAAGKRERARLATEASTRGRKRK